MQGSIKTEHFIYLIKVVAKVVPCQPHILRHGLAQGKELQHTIMMISLLACSPQAKHGLI